MQLYYINTRKMILQRHMSQISAGAVKKNIVMKFMLTVGGADMVIASFS